jgi:DNA-binding response OmpR family regulator
MPSPIFIVDSSPAVRRMVEDISTPEGFEVVGFQDGPAALEAARRITPALIIADYHLDNMTFSGFCKEVNKLDHLTETYVISLINAGDRPDEGHLRTLGVKAFLEKPFQSDDLLDIIKSLQLARQKQASGAGLKRRAWPPVSTATDSDEDDVTASHIEDPQEREEAPMDHRIESSATSALPAAPSSAEPDDVMKSLFGQLLRSFTDWAEKRLSDLLPAAIEQKLATQVRPIVQKELAGQLGEILSQEQLALIIQPLLTRELPGLIQKEMAAFEPIIRQTVSDRASILIQDTLEQVVRDQADAGMRKLLPDVVREHLGKMEEVVKNEVRQATLKQTPVLAEEIVRTSAERAVEQAVQRIVPDLAEQHIKAELQRLSDEAEAIPPVSA